MYIDGFYLAVIFLAIFFGAIFAFIYWAHDKASLDDVDKAIYEADKEMNIIELIEPKNEEIARVFSSASLRGRIKHKKEIEGR